jgi:hypothetical protein
MTKIVTQRHWDRRSRGGTSVPPFLDVFEDQSVGQLRTEYHKVRQLPQFHVLACHCGAIHEGKFCVDDFPVL